MSVHDASRRRRSIVGVVVVAAVVVSGIGLVTAARATRRAPSNPASSIAKRVIARDLARLDTALQLLDVVMTSSSSRDTAAAGAAAASRLALVAFGEARMRYKRVEGVVEFYSPALAAALDSRRQEVDDEDAPPPSSLGPRGFPALEDLLMPHGVSRGAGVVDGAPDAHTIIGAMGATVRSLINASTQLVVTNAQLMEIGRLEIARVSTLGIAGFDAPHTGRAMIESADALDGVRDLYDSVSGAQWPRLERERHAVDSAFAAASNDLRANPDFLTFDRLGFLALFAEPAARSLDRLRRAIGTEPVLMRRPWRVEAPSVYDSGAFDARAYAPSDAPLATPELVALGARLFTNPRLSGTGTRACASCHEPSHALTDGLMRAPSIDAHGALVARHTPTLLNAALQPAQFDDERSVTLEQQVGEVLRSPAEMASSVERAAATLGSDADSRTAFAATFHVPPDSAVTGLRVRLALAAYVRSLVALDSRFDRAVRGDTAQLTSQERHGFTVFMGKAACGTCHFAPLFSGNTPPLYLGSDVEVIGTPVSPRVATRLDPDSGRGRIDHLPIHVRAFKTPSLRNVAATAPYMHNGAFRTLEEVVDFYDHGGGEGAGARIGNQTLAPDSLHLTTDEKSALIAFLRALTDTVTRRAP